MAGAPLLLFPFMVDPIPRYPASLPLLLNETLPAYLPCHAMLLLAYLPCHATACLPARTCYCLPTCHAMLLPAYLPRHTTACLPATPCYCPCLPATPCYCLPTCYTMLLPAYLPRHATACLPATPYYCLPTCHDMLLPAYLHHLHLEPPLFHSAAFTFTPPKTRAVLSPRPSPPAAGYRCLSWNSRPLPPPPSWLQSQGCWHRGSWKSPRGWMLHWQRCVYV